MAGVAGPMLRRNRADGVRFLSGLLAGGLLASALVATLVYVVGSVLSMVLPHPVRTAAAIAIVCALGIADLANRTPHVWRQVPQAFVRTLRPGRLGLVWGFDLALLVTTQKTTSLTWASLAVLGLLYPAAAWLVLLSMTAVGVLTVAVRSTVVVLRGPSAAGDRTHAWFRYLRWVAGVS